MLFDFYCEQMCKSASDGNWGHGSDAVTRNSKTHLGVVSWPNFHNVYKEGLVFCMSDIFATWDGVTLKIGSSNQIAEGISVLAWCKQEIES